MAKIRCVVERITYQNPENGYCVLKARVKGQRELVPVVGNLPDMNAGAVLIVEGEWKVDPRYGRQFLAQKWEETMPATVYGIEKYLGSGLIKGVGPTFAKKIVQQFGTETLQIIEEDVQRLQEIPGIGQKRIQMIKEGWERQKEIKNVMLFLQDCGVSTALAVKIYKQYGNKSIETVKENPYRLADEVWGIGFKTADSIAGRLGFSREAFFRLRSGLLYTLSALADEGHVFAEKWQLIQRASTLLEAEESTVIMTLDHILKEGDLIRDILPGKEEKQTEAVYLPPFYYAEIGTANKLKKLLAAPAKDRLWVQLGHARKRTGNAALSIDISRIEQAVGRTYDEIQADAIRQAAMAKVMVLTGGPGTGKTTTIQGIIAAYRAFGLKILLAAPTGRAAKRMTETTGLEAKTIHRLLECKPPEGYKKNEEEPLEGDVLIVDECSMIDIVLMNALLKAISLSMRLILVGDIDQLPSVGAGNVLRDILSSGAVPSIRLTRVFRQAKTSRIIQNAHRVNQGKLPDISNGAAADFFFVRQETPELAQAAIIELVKKKLPAYYKIPASQIQVLTPMQRGAAGAASLNTALQNALNPAGEGLHRMGLTYRAGDKVMQIRNNYDKEVFNGDIGMVSSIDFTEKTLAVDFDGRRVEYDITELDELAHAYAVTIHKAQGSEYPVVVMPLLMAHSVMLQRNLLYTGITRARKLLVLVGSREALAYAVKNATVTSRNTRLKERLQEMAVGKAFYPEAAEEMPSWEERAAETPAAYGSDKKKEIP